MYVQQQYQIKQHGGYTFSIPFATKPDISYLKKDARFDSPISSLDVQMHLSLALNPYVKYKLQSHFLKMVLQIEICSI